MFNADNNNCVVTIARTIDDKNTLIFRSCPRDIPVCSSFADISLFQSGLLSSSRLHAHQILLSPSRSEIKIGIQVGLVLPLQANISYTER